MKSYWSPNFTFVNADELTFVVIVNTSCAGNKELKAEALIIKRECLSLEAVNGRVVHSLLGVFIIV